MYVYLHTKFQDSSIILTSVKQGGVGGNFTLLSPTAKQTPKKPSQIRVNTLSFILF